MRIEDQIKRGVTHYAWKVKDGIVEIDTEQSEGEKCKEAIYTCFCTLFQTKQLYHSCDEIPKVFWKYYDLYRRGKITLRQYVDKSGISESEIVSYLNTIKQSAGGEKLEIR